MRPKGGEAPGSEEEKRIKKMQGIWGAEITERPILQ